MECNVRYELALKGGWPLTGREERRGEAVVVRLLLIFLILVVEPNMMSNVHHRS